MTIEKMTIYFNAAICIIIAARLMFFCKENKTHRPIYAWLAYLVIIASGFTAFRLLLGHYYHVDYGELALNACFCAIILNARGNMAKLISR